ncbi:zf-CCHC domain-containing protein [Tanacetum coccineum]
MEKDSEIYKGKKERIKSIALKAKKESSDDETSTSGSDDEEYAMAVRNFKKFFRRKGKFVRQPREERKSFRQRDEKKGKSDRKCFRCGDPSHLIGDCLKNLAPKIKRLSLEVLGAIARMTPKTKPRTKLVSWLNPQMSANSLREMLNNKKSPSFKIGLGFDNDKASTSGTKTMSFVGSSAEKVTDGSTIKGHKSTLPGSVCLRTCLELDEWIKDSGCSKHMTGNKSLFSAYKAYDGEFEMSMMGELNFFLGLQIKQMEDGIFFNQSKYIKEMLKKFGLEDSKPTKTPMSTKIKLTKDDEADSVDSSKYQDLRTTDPPEGNPCFIEVDPCVTDRRQMDEELRESYRTLKKRLLHEGRTVTPSFISENNMLPFFQAVGLDPFLTLNKPICPRFVVEFYHSLEVKRDEELRPYIELKLGQFTFKLTPSQLSQILKTPHTLETFYTCKWSLNSLDDHPNSNFFGPKHDLVKKAITTPRTTQAQLLRDPNKLYIDDIRPNLKRMRTFL